MVGAVLAACGFAALPDDTGGTTVGREILDADEDAALERVAGRETGGGLAAFAVGGCAAPVFFGAVTVVFDLADVDELAVTAGLTAFFSTSFVGRVSFFGDSGETTSGFCSSFGVSVTRSTT